MRFTVLFFLVAGFWIPVISQSKKIDSLQFITFNYIKTNPLNIVYGPNQLTSEWGIMYEQNIFRRQSLNLGASFLGENIFVALNRDKLYGSGNPPIKIRGFRVHANYKFYFSQFESNSEGYYFAPQISYAVTKYSYKQPRILYNYLNVENWNICGTLGFQQVIFEKFCLDIYAGLGYKKKIWTEHETSTKYRIIPSEDAPKDFLGSFYPHLKIMLGFSLGVII